MAPKVVPKAKAPVAKVSAKAPAAKAVPAPKAKAELPAKATGPLGKAASPPAKAGAANASSEPKSGENPSSPAGGGAAAAKALKAQKEAEEDEERRQKENEEAEAEAVRKAEEEKKAEEERRKAEEERKKAEAEAEAERKRKQEKANGEVVCKYNMYAEKFQVKDGKMKAADIDDLYCLSDVMPNCKIHLSAKSSEEKYKIISSGEIFPYVFEDPVGTFHDLEAGEEYYVYVEEDEEEFLKSLEKAKQNFKGVKGAATRGEGCSCIEGNPCASECDAQGNTICLDWPNRFAVAKAHGWIGYQAK